MCDRRTASIDGVAPRKRTRSKLEVHNSSSNRNIPVISMAPFNERLQSELDEVRHTDPTPIDLRVKSLPTEILFQVFEHLPLKDRKNVRLVCKLWNEECTRAPITGREKIVFRATCGIADVKTLLTSSFVVMNLEFHTPLVNSLSADMWKKFGHRVLEINFYFECSLRHETLENMILNCANLTSLKLWYYWEPSLNSKMLNILIDKGVKRRRLKTFATFHKSYSTLVPSTDILEKIFVIFPCVKRFCVKNPSRSTQLEGKLLLLKLPTQLESLEYIAKTHDSWLENSILPVWKSRLIRFGAMIKQLRNEAKIFQFFAIQTELESVTLWLKDCNGGEFTKKLMFHVLEQCSKLKEFRLSASYKQVSLTTPEYEKFLVLISKLRVLTIDFHITVGSAPTLSPINLALNTISFVGNFDLHSDASSFDILMFSSRLHHLKITWATDLLLQKIFENMLDLKTLILDSWAISDPCTKFRFTGQDSTRDGGYSIKRLQQLEHLEIRDSPLELDIMEIAHEFQLPRLKHFEFHVNSLDVDLCQITSNTPALESLIVDFHVLFSLLRLNENFLGHYWLANKYGVDEEGFSVKQTIEFCTSLRKLKYLRMPIAFKVRDPRNTTTMRPLFESCPSLRYVQPCPRKSNIVFSRDPISREVRFHRLERPFNGFSYSRKLPIFVRDTFNNN